MLKWMMILLTCFYTSITSAQSNVPPGLEKAFHQFTTDPQLKYGLAGICLLDANTGKLLFENNSNIAMVPASTQKIITTIAAYEALGQNYQYQTSIGYTGKISGNILQGNLVITGSGDPTLASFRYAGTMEEVVLEKFLSAVKNAGIDSISGDIIGTDNGFDLNAIPDGWSWSDMGNYYGAGHWAINWNENQYDLFIKTGRRENDPVVLTGSKPAPFPVSTIINDVQTGRPNTGDGSIIYADPFSKTALFQGKLEPNRSRFTVSGSIPNADLLALNTIKSYLEANNIHLAGEAKNMLYLQVNEVSKPNNIKNLDNLSSPSMDSMVYWFLRKSVNLYGEAFLRTIGLEKKGLGSTRKGLEWIESFYGSNGFDTEALHLYDGSGLSAANRITPYVLTRALYFAKNKNWFPSFYDALPLYNGMKLKSGTIGRVKCFAGYHTSRSGNQYIVALMVNNYNSSPSALVNKMFSVLDKLK